MKFVVERKLDAFADVDCFAVGVGSGFGKPTFFLSIEPSDKLPFGRHVGKHFNSLKDLLLFTSV